MTDVAVGDYLSISDMWYQVATVTSNTELTLANAYLFRPPLTDVAFSLSSWTKVPGPRCRNGPDIHEAARPA